MIETQEENYILLYLMLVELLRRIKIDYNETKERKWISF